MEAVDVLDRPDRLDDPCLVDLIREGELDENPGDTLVCVELVDQRKEHVLSRVVGELVMERLDAGLGARLPLRADVDG